MAYWRRYLDRINEEYTVVLRKRQALNRLLSSGRISQSTFETFDREMESTIAEIEKQRKLLLEKISVKTMELEERIKVLEKLLANLEIQHVGGEIEDENYQRDLALLNVGLENAKKELELTKEVINELTGSPKALEMHGSGSEASIKAKISEGTEQELDKTEATEVKEEKVEELHEVMEEPAREIQTAETPQEKLPSSEEIIKKDEGESP
ncbi:MAG: CdvA-like protein [Candidatus Bathyarchaeota archaeon]|nr:CdvA-like protein [Candidatus Bathyarchaeota archaeon]